MLKWCNELMYQCIKELYTIIKCRKFIFQDLVERATIDVIMGRVVLEPGSYIQQTPVSCYIEDRYMCM